MIIVNYIRNSALCWVSYVAKQQKIEPARLNYMMHFLK